MSEHARHAPQSPANSHAPSTTERVLELSRRLEAGLDPIPTRQEWEAQTVEAPHVEARQPAADIPAAPKVPPAGHENLPAMGRRVTDRAIAGYQTPHLQLPHPLAPFSTLPGSQSVTSPQTAHPGGLLEYWQMLRRRKWLLVLTVILGGIVGLLVLLPQTPVFRASTTIEVLDMNSGITGLKDGSTGPNPTEATNLQTQVDIIGSATLQQRVVARLIASEKTIEQPVDRLEKWRRVLNLPAKPLLSKQDILNGTAGGITANASSSSRIIRVDCESSNPKVAADYVNTLAEEFISERLESHWQATQRTSEYLTKQLEELKVRLMASEDALQNYAKATGLQFIGDQGNQSVMDQKLGHLDSELSTAQADRIAKQSRYELADNAPIDTLPEVLDDPSLKLDHQKLADAKRALAELTVTYTAEAPEVKKLQSQISAIETDMGKIRSRILDHIRGELEVAKTREKLLTDAATQQAGLVSAEASKAIHYNILKREVDTNREVWESLLQRVKEAGISAAMRSSNFRVVDPAMPPTIPVKPIFRQGIMAGMVLGLFAGIGLVFLRENMDHSIALPGETAYYLGSPELAVVPSKALEGGRWKMFGTGGRLGQKLLAGSEGMVERSAFNQTDSLVAESFRVALTSLLFANRSGNPPRAIAVSSPGPAEGKTTVACNLAISYAEINWRVLLIDADMRRPRLHNIFGVDNETGLATLLEGTEPTEPEDVAAVVQATAIPNLSVMTRGRLRGTVINMLYSPRFSEVLQLAREEFDVVVLDTPPMLHLPDARAIAHMTDGVVFVVRSGKTLRDTVITARDRFRQDGIPVLGSILNDWNPKDIGYYGHANYEAYRTSYYGTGPSEDPEA